MRFTGFLLISLAISPLAFSGEIMTDNTIEVLAINGVKVKNSFFSNTIPKVKDGKNQIVVRYSNSFRNDRLIESRPYIFTINVNGQTSISTDKVNSYTQAEQKIKEGLNWYIKNELTEYQVKNTEQLKGEGFAPYADIEGLITKYNQTNNLAVTQTSITKIKTNNLIEMYKSANIEQKKQFKIWLINNETK